MRQPVGGRLGRGPAGEEEVLPGGEVGEEGESLRDIAHATLLDGHVLHCRVAVPDGPGIGAVEPGQTAQERRLARSRRAEDGHVVRRRPVGEGEMERHRRDGRCRNGQVAGGTASGARASGTVTERRAGVSSRIRLSTTTITATAMANAVGARVLVSPVPLNWL